MIIHVQDNDREEEAKRRIKDAEQSEKGKLSLGSFLATRHSADNGVVETPSKDYEFPGWPGACNGIIAASICTRY